MARPNWEWIRVDVLMPDHPKVESLSDRAFRELVKLWCYSGLHRTDGIITSRRWKAVPPKARRELVENGLARDQPLGGAVMHDYTEHQRTRDEIDELAARRAEIARNAANARWAKGHEKPP